MGLKARLKIAAVAATAAVRVALSWKRTASRLKIAAVAATAAFFVFCGVKSLRAPPQDCRSRGDCGISSRRNIESDVRRLKIAAVAATAAMKRGKPRSTTGFRLKIAAVAATAAGGGIAPATGGILRLKIAAVAATAAGTTPTRPIGLKSASRLPQSRRLRHGFGITDFRRQIPASRLPQSRRLRLAPWNTLRINACRSILRA